MALIEPPGDEGDFDFDALEAELREAATSDVLNVSLLNDSELLEKFHQVTDELRERKELLSTHSATGRDLHSLRAALRVELSRRKLM